MSQTETGKTQVSRRTLAKGAAWSVPVIATAAAAPAASASTTCTPGATKSFQSAALTFTCKSVTPIAGLDLKQWTATITGTFPESVGANCEIAPGTITADVTTSVDAANIEAGFNVKNILSGSSVAKYSVTGATPATGSSDLTVQGTPIPVVNGTAISTSASGTSGPATAAASGEVVITVGDFTVTLATDGAAPLDSQSVTCALDAGQDATLATIPIV